MLQFGTINFKGGRRSYYDVEVKVQEIRDERHWKNLWLKKTKKVYLEVISPPEAEFENAMGEKIDFPTKIIVHDFAKQFTNLTISEVALKIGYADAYEQYHHGVNVFTASILINNLQFELV